RRIPSNDTARMGKALELEELALELLAGRDQAGPGAGDLARMALDESQAVPLGEGEGVDVDLPLLDVDQTRRAEVIELHHLVEMAEIDAQVGADDAQLVGPEVRAGEIDRLPRRIEEQGADRVVIVGEQVGQ